MNKPVSQDKTPDLAKATDPFDLFQSWYSEAETREPNDANAMSLATVDANGLPNVRIVLLKGLDGPDIENRGFVFYTNFESAKGQELLAHPKAALAFHWKSLRRQVRVRGVVSVVSGSEADVYYASRPRLSRVGAWASNQSRPLEGRADLEAAVAHYTAKFGSEDIPRPVYWSGFRVTPVEIEFWMDGAFRLHDRIVFRQPEAPGAWSKTRLFP
jgi:pyridoxamine 5'-phosphate oxidase